MDAKNRPVGTAVEREILWRAFRDNTDLWLETVWKITRPGKRPALIELYPSQRDVIDWYETPYPHRTADMEDEPDKYVALKGRQIGWTTITTAWAFKTAVFQEYTPWLFVSHNEDYAKKNLGMVKFGYRNLPEWVKEKIGEPTAFTTEMVGLANGSRIESIPATGSSGRGDAVWGLMWDETAYAPDPDGLMGAIGEMVYGKFIALSTANGMGNLFHSLYEGAKSDPEAGWQSKFISWRARPSRDDAWYERTAKDAKYKGRQWLLHQEHPNNDVEAFAKSGKTPIGADLLDEYDWLPPGERMVWTVDGEARFDTAPPDMDLDDHPLVLDVWERPFVERHEKYGYALRNPNYVMFWDVAEGNVDGDYSAIVVYNANTRQCAARVRTHYPAEELPEVAAWLGYWYHTALLAVERNHHGWGVLQILDRTLHYPRLYRMSTIASRKRGQTDMLGWHTNNATRPKMVSDFARELRAHNIEPYDPVLLSELRTFVQDDTGKYQASAGNHDDVVIAHMGAVQVMEQVDRFPTVWRDEEFEQVTRMSDIDALADGKFDQKPTIPRITESGGSKSAIRPSFWVVPRD